MARRPALLVALTPLVFLALTARAQVGTFAVRVIGDHELSLRESVLQSDGRVHITTGDLEVFADTMSFDLGAAGDQIAEFRGNVELRAPHQTYRGARLVMNLTAGTWRFTEVRGVLDPALFPQGVVAPVFVGAQEAGVDEAGHPFAFLGDLTTCDLPDPHWELRAREVVIEPGRRLVARGVSFYALGRRLFSIPRWIINFTGPRQQPVIPTIGSSAREGLFLQTAFPYELSPHAYGDFRLRLMSERGVGFSIDHFWFGGGAAGRISLTQVHNTGAGGDELTGRVEYRQALGARTALRLFADQRQGTFLFDPSVSERHAQLALDHTGNRAATHFVADYSRQTGFFDRETVRSELTHMRQIGTVSLLVSPQYRAIDAIAGFPADEEVRTLLQLRAPSRVLDLALLFDRTFDVDGSKFPLDNAFQIVQRLPEVGAYSSLDRLGVTAPWGIPLLLSATVGRYTERSTTQDTERAMFRLDAPPSTHPALGGALTIGGGFRQTTYSDPSSVQYVYEGTLDWERRLTGTPERGWSLNLDYSLLQSRGFTPFRFDFASERELAASGLRFHSPRSDLLLGVGFDAQNDRWQNLLVRGQHDFGSGFVVTTTAGYDLNAGRPLDLLARVQRRSGAFAWGIATRMNLDTGAVRRAAAELDWTFGDWRFRALSGWNGSTNRFLYNEFLLSHDLHCWELLLYYSEQRKEFRADLRLKAFQFGTGAYGTGRFGQRTDLGMGDRY